MRDSIYLAWKYVCHHRGTTAVLIASVTLIVYLPAALQTIVNNAEQHFRSRADSTPLVVGPRGSELQLVLASAYFDKPYENVLKMEQLQQLENQELGQSIPLHTRFRARGCTIVGTTKQYAQMRGLMLARGSMWDVLGDCVVGASVAERLDLEIGDKIPVSTSTAFLLDNAPLRMKVKGIFAPTETADDEAIFVNLKTTWLVEGLGHGHLSGAEHGSPDALLYTDITKENVDSFHFHGNPLAFPISAIIVRPNSPKSETLLLGKYFSEDAPAQIVRPREVIDGLLSKVLMIRSYMIAIVAVVSLVTLLTMALVIVLTIRLRQKEIATMTKIGCSRLTIASILGSQVLIILALSSTIATGLTLLTNAYGPELVRYFILS